MTGASLGNVVVGLYGLWHNQPGDRSRNVPESWFGHEKTSCDLGLVVSNDAIHYREPIRDFRIVPCWEEPESTSGGLYDTTRGARTLAQGQGFENMGDETLFWYELWGQGRVRLATWPRDRLGYFEVCSVRRPQRWAELLGEPHFISRPLKLDEPGCRVFLNADGLAQNNQLTVEVCDEQLRTLPGYSAEDCIAAKESGLRVPVAWREKKTIDEVDGPVRVKVSFGGVRPEDIRLYAVYLSPS